MHEEANPYGQQYSTGDPSIALHYRFFSQTQTLDFLRYLDLALCRFLSISSRAAAASFRHLRLNSMIMLHIITQWASHFRVTKGGRSNVPGVVYFALDQRKILGYSFTVSEEEEGIPKSGFENG